MKRAARSMRSGSSRNETSGASGVRSRRAARSAAPPNGSTSSGSGSRNAIALTVKSRRERSVSMSSEYATSGLRLSGRYTSARNVVISMRDAVLAAADGAEALALEPDVVGPRAHELLDDLGTGVGGDVDVGLVVAHARSRKRVADAPAHEEALVPGVGEQARELLHAATRRRAAAARRGGIAVIGTILVGSGTVTAETIGCRHPRALPSRHAPLPSPEWTARHLLSARLRRARGGRASRSTHASRLVWLDPLGHGAGRGAGVLCAHPRRPDVPAARLDPPRPARRASRGSGSARPGRRRPRDRRPRREPARSRPRTAPRPPSALRQPRAHAGARRARERSARPRPPRRSSPRS